LVGAGRSAVLDELLDGLGAKKVALWLSIDKIC